MVSLAQLRQREQWRRSKRDYRERLKEGKTGVEEPKRYPRCKYSLREEGQIFIDILSGVSVEKCAVIYELSPKTIRQIITYWREKFNEKWPPEEPKKQEPPKDIPKKTGFPF